MPKKKDLAFRHPDAWQLDVPVNASESQRAEALRRQTDRDLTKLFILARRYGIDPKEPGAGWALALRLAYELHPEPDNGGRTVQWNELNRAALRVEIELVQRRSTVALTKATADRTVLGKRRWRWVLKHSDNEKTIQAILRQSSQADGPWLETLRHAASYYLLDPESGNRLEEMLDHFAKPMVRMSIEQKIRNHQLAGALLAPEQSRSRK